jgi:hypothetical protein
MNQLDDKDRSAPRSATPRASKKPYAKPAVRYERVFETSALTCGKVQTTQSSCHQNRKLS